MQNVIILVAGLVRCGKSTFINALLRGEERVVVHHSLSSVATDTTQIISVKIDSTMSSFVPNDTCLTIVESPGFNEDYLTGETDTKKLVRISKWLESSLSNGAIFGGVIYLHEISEDRFSTIPSLELMALRKSFDSSSPPLERLALVTTKWEKSPAISTSGDSKEKELIKDKWITLIERGSKVHRFMLNNDKGYSSGWAVVNHLLTRAIDPPNITKQLSEFRQSLSSISRNEQSSVLATIVKFFFPFCERTGGRLRK